MKKKRLLCGIVSAAMAVSAIALPAVSLAEEDTITVMVDNDQVEFDQQPTIIEGRTLVPIRAVFEKAGASVEWDQARLTATIAYGENTVRISPDKDIMFRNDKAVALDVPAQMINDRILIPVRAISDALDFGVTWNGYLSTVLIATDGKPYRAFLGVKRGFRDLAAVSDFYINGSCVNNEADLNGDGVKETVSFTQTTDTAAAEMPLLVINGSDFSDMIKEEYQSLNSLAVISMNGTEKQVVIVENGDVQTAHFYTYDGTELVKCGENPSISFKTRLLFDERKYVLSDLHGLCFTDIMVTGSFYEYAEDGFSYFKLSNAEDIAPRVLIHTYNDNMTYRMIKTDKYVPGAYKGAQEFETINSEAFTQFTLLEMYVSPQNPAYAEFYIETPDGTRAVLTPYTV